RRVRVRGLVPVGRVAVLLQPPNPERLAVDAEKQVDIAARMSRYEGGQQRNRPAGLIDRAGVLVPREQPAVTGRGEAVGGRGQRHQQAVAGRVGEKIAGAVRPGLIYEINGIGADRGASRDLTRGTVDLERLLQAAA